MSLPNPAGNAWKPSSLLGRDALLRSLGTRLPTEKRLIIGVDPGLHCRRGVGRSRLVSELVRRVASQYSHVITLCGSSPIAWHSSLIEATRQLEIRPATFRRDTDLTGALRSWFDAHENWLLVVDSVSDLDDLNSILEGVRSGHVIVAVDGPNATNIPGWSAAVPLGNLSSDDGLQLLRHAIERDWSNTEEIVAATRLVNILERNPLGTELAGRALWLTGLTPQDGVNLLLGTSNTSPLQSILGLMLSSLATHHPETSSLLAASVALGGGSLPIAILQNLSKRLSDANDSFQRLIDCGLFRLSEDGLSVSLPVTSELSSLLSPAVKREGIALAQSALTPRVMRNRLHEHVCGDLPQDPDLVMLPRIALGQTVATSTTLETDQIRTIREAADAAIDLLLPKVAVMLLQRVLDHAIQNAVCDEALQEPLVEIGMAYVLSEQFQLARKRWRQAIEVCPTEHPMLTELLLAIAEIDVNENRLDRAAGRLNLASDICKKHPDGAHVQLLKGQLKYLKAGVALGQSQTESARNQFRAALDMRTALLPVDHVLLMRNRLMLARTEFLLKNYEASEKLLIEEVAIRERSSNVTATELGVACNFLSDQYYLSGRLSDAEPVYERTLELRRTTLPRGNRLIGEMTSRLAVIKSARGAYKEADVLFRESLSILEETYGSDHPEVARVLNDLAESLFAQNKVEPARRLLERALTIQERSLRKNDARLGRTRCNLAAVYVARGRFAEAVRLYERDVAERQSHKTTDQASLATSLNNLAEALRSLGRYGEAESRLQQSLAIREQMVGPDHPQVAQILNNLGYLYLQQHRYDKSRECLHRALKIREASLSPNHPHLATTLGTLAEVYFTEGQHEDARTLYARAIDIYITAHGERHPHAASLQICSARNELRLGHVGRAELMLLRGQSIITEVLGNDHRMAAKVLLGLAELAQSERRYEAAFPLLERSLSIQYGTMSSQRLEIAETLGLIARNLVQRGLFADALPRLVEAVEIQQTTLGGHHAEVMPNLVLIGRIQNQLGEAGAAEEALRTVIEEAELATQAPLIDEARELLPDVLIQSQKYDEAAAILSSRVQSLDERDPSPQLVNALSQLAGIHYLREVHDAAAPLMERCVELSELLHGPDSAETAKHLDNLAGVRFLLGQFDRAEPAIQRAIGILERDPSAHAAALTKARDNYIQLLRRTNRTAEADQQMMLVKVSQPSSAGQSTSSGQNVSEPPVLIGHVLDDL